MFDFSIISNYLNCSDWRINENSNMSYSLQGLNNHITQEEIKKFWLNKIYPEYISKAHIDGALHIHDLGSLSTYCMGWDLFDLLARGFCGVKSKPESEPPKHFRSALAQIWNFLCTTQGEVAGAIALSNFDTLLAPFITYDNLSYKEVKQCMQEFIWNMNIPTRTGFQCLSEDTKILTVDGWKLYNEIHKGDDIVTFNKDTKNLENKKVINMSVKKYNGKMINLKNKVTDQLLTPNHNVLRYVFNSPKLKFEKALSIYHNYKSPVCLPIGSNGILDGKYTYTENEVKLLAWILSDGNIFKETVGFYRVSIYQSKKKYFNEILELCNKLNLTYSISENTYGVGSGCMRIRFNSDSNHKIFNLFKFKDTKKIIPNDLFKSNKNLINIFLKEYIKGDGNISKEKYSRTRIYTIDFNLYDGLCRLLTLTGAAFTTRKTICTKIQNYDNKNDLYIINILKKKNCWVTKKEEVDYNGIVWCPTTENQTVIALRNGKVFITGNSPFSNITLDLIPPKHLKDKPVIIGGKLQQKKYEEFQSAMNMLNKAFCEVMIAGDRKGMIFTFPIPTYNLTKDFNWDAPIMKHVFDMTAKLGLPYFANYVNSEMSPEDSVSMCPIAGKELLMIQSSRYVGRYELVPIKSLYRSQRSSGKTYNIFSNGTFIPGKINKFENQKMFKINLKNGHVFTASKEHLHYVKVGKASPCMTLKTKELVPGNYLPYSLNVLPGEGGDFDLGYFIGAFAGDGSIDDSAVVFSLHKNQKKSVAKNLIQYAKTVLGASITETVKDNLLSLHIRSKTAVALCVEFVHSKERTKHYSDRIYSLSIICREGILAGHIATDGDNKQRIYSSSSKMVKSLNLLASTLGRFTSIAEDSRTINEGSLSNYPNYSVNVLQLTNSCYGHTWFKEDGLVWVSIEEILEDTRTSVAYCVEVLDGHTPIFTVATTGILTHNCRLRLNTKQLRRGGLFSSNPLTGSLGVVTLNLPHIFYENKYLFFENLSKYLNIAKDALQIKRDEIEKYMEQGLYPYSKFYLETVKHKTGQYYANHFSTIGIIGMHEMLLNCEIINGINSDKGLSMSKNILKFIKEELQKFQDEGNILYNLEATPAEGCSYRLAKLDKTKWPDIITNGTEETPFYTNSTQLPVDVTTDIFSALEHQDKIQPEYTGGTVFHGFLGENIPDWEVCKNLIKKITQNYSLPYFTITPTFSICQNHGYLSGKVEICPECKEICNVYSRIVGYFRPVKQWNIGKRQEFKQRKEFELD